MYKIFGIFSIFFLASCATAPPSSPNNLCGIFDEYPRWYRASVATEEKWGLLPEVGLSFIFRESSFQSDAKPPRYYFLGFIPWGRTSSAYGYAQITDQAWQDYTDDTGSSWFKRRNDFEDAMDFIGWYNDRTNRVLGINKNDAYNLYLVYYEGLGGYRTGNWRTNEDVKRYAREVQERTAYYGEQLSSCRSSLKSYPWQIF
ncbi:MAG: hypothetical protein CBC38_04615 [Gammaproteobacteria bacterium TMED78]|nr:MAG: hypothetical protein CBC38_04615 [Gammaproteobacteria bacterium TMED78]